MAWNSFATPAIGKGVRWASRLLHHGGSAFPGKVIETIDPGFLARTLGCLPLGVVLVSGTNGKTTTTRMVASMLSDLGLKVFTNPTGSNFTRGVVSALLQQVTLGGRLDADIAVLELDEAYAVHFVKQVKPRYALLLNVMRDQLDRFGEIDNTARLLGEVAKTTTGTVVLNREDPRIAALAALTPAGTQVRYFGLSDELKKLFPSDDDMATTVSVEGEAAETTPSRSATDSPRQRGREEKAETVRKSEDEGEAVELPADVTFTAFGDHRATFRLDGDEHTTDVKLEGVYNLYNAAAALAVVRAVVADAPRARTAAAPAGGEAFRERLRHVADSGTDALIRAVARVTPAFGRGEVIEAAGSPVELLLVKNPMGFRLSLASFPPEGADTMIVINDEYADGRDMSWLWDVDFTSLRGTGVAQVSGVRAWDMALRLAYDQVPVAATDTDIESALNLFVHANPGTPKHIYCTYTAMLKVRAALGRIADVADAGVGE
ncbi:Mur ligase family protein [Bifidobacterium stellenboschense]|uniref:Lipid II isoglutaminyl synthase (glutamine-hydrolyzing) subunit MurT n=1 Tax=Bifidobacterium stellenboschense TaxID=762211 RepID=A0A087DNA9_9BIFI|nr:Mur ligase family protein [Bifidobacterium stellenboschense]KFI97009.1 glutamate ligase [Bifidobacterium stellenboschense]